MKLLFTVPAIAALLMGSVAMAEEPKADETKEEVVPGILRPLSPKANENSVIQKQGKPAWMILSFGGVGLADSSHIREFNSMESCERIAEHIAMVRSPMDKTSTKGVAGAWKYNRKNLHMKKMVGGEPLVFMLCVPDVSEIQPIADELTNREWYKYPIK